MLDAGLLAPIDTSQITRWDDLDPTFRDAHGVDSRRQAWSWCRCRPDRTGIIYDKAAFPNGVDSYQTLFDPQYAGRVALDGSWLTAVRR